MAQASDIGLASWHLITHPNGRRTALRQVLVQLSPTVQGRLALISDDGSVCVVRCYADPHGCNPRSTQLVATFADAQRIGDDWLRAWRDDLFSPPTPSPYEFAYWSGDKPY